jgi:hypothetical protein
LENLDADVKEYQNFTQREHRLIYFIEAQAMVEGRMLKIISSKQTSQIAVVTRSK